MQLSDPLSDHFRLTALQKEALHTLGIETIEDLLFHFPSRYEESGSATQIDSLTPGASVSLVGTLEKLETKKSWKHKIPISQGYLRDATGRIALMWFHQPYIAKMYVDGMHVRVTGKVTGSANKLYVANPNLERISPADTGMFSSQEGEAQELFAIYPESRGITSLWFRHAFERITHSGVIETIEDPIPEDIVSRYHLPTLKTALLWIHMPKELKNAEAARKRFAFQEVFLIQLHLGQERRKQSHQQSFRIQPSKEMVDSFMNDFPFSATRAQKHAIAAILKDMAQGHPMSRLLEGDVGSGKTAVAATISYAAVTTRPQGQTFGTLQVAYMAPTEILAKQHFESFISYFRSFPINIGLITGSGCYKFPSKISKNKATTISRAQLLKWVANGEIPILIGTHALIQKSVQWKHLALVIIDEQHRFGTNQRRALARKETRIPHLLSMTATPIPRTLALTIYGDLDLTLLDEMPPGRKPVITDIIKPEQRKKMYETIRTELQAGRQAYVICPRIDEPDPEKAFALLTKSVKEEAKRLQKEVFPEYRIAILHSKMKPAEKDAVMQAFANHDSDILVATSVVEVGVNVPNATIILIEGAERFGLAQLHQLRGRVIRSTHQAYCFICPQTKSALPLARLKHLVTAKNGFALAEQDLLQRGPGELSGRKQWGISDIGMEALKNLKLVEAARTEAFTLVEQDETLQKHPLLARALLHRAQTMHLE